MLNGFDMLFQVFDAFQNGRNIFFFQLIRRNTAVQLQRSGRCDNDDRIRFQLTVAAFDIKEFLCAQIRTEPASVTT